MSTKAIAAIAAIVAAATFPAGPSIVNVVRAAEIRVLSGTGAKGAVLDIGRQFEVATGHKVVTEFGGFAALKRKIDAGGRFDVVILSPAMIDELAGLGKVAADTRATLGRTGVGVAVRKGAPRPDIGSVEAFKRAMLDARSIAYSKSGRTGKVFLAALDRLGIAAELKPRMKAYARPEAAVVAGEAEIGVTGVAPILAASGAELVGGLPAEIQSYVVFTIGANAGSTEPEAARALIRFLTAPDAAPVMRANGLETN